MKPIDLLTEYQALLAEFGKQHWWPLTAGRWRGKTFRPSQKTPQPEHYSPHFEVIAGTILTQNTAWRNVEPSIRNLFDAGSLAPEPLVEMDDDALRAAIRSSGYFNQKADRLKRIARFIIDDFSGNSAAMASKIERDALLALNGVGPETADSILLYAGFRPFFVIDAYTRRWLQSFNIEFKNYEDYRRYFEDNLPRNVALYNEFHALIVRLQGRYYGGRLIPKPDNTGDLRQ
ncbi:MAG: hypothetical protein ABIH86_07260 [Planctomycetota bacterium]